MPSRFDEALTLLQGPRVLNKANSSKCVPLMKEFLRREAIWARRLGIAEDLPFVELPRAIDSSVDYDKPLKELVRLFAASVDETKCCLRMLDWYGLERDRPEALLEFELPDPYLPLLRLFTLGDMFSSEHRYYIDLLGGALHSGEFQHGALDKPHADVEVW